MATRIGALTLGCISGYISYYYLNRELNNTTSYIESKIASIGSRINTLRVISGDSSALSGILVQPTVIEPLHPRPPVPVTNDIYYQAIYNTVVQKWNRVVRNTHNNILDFIVQQDGSSNTQTSNQTTSQ